MRAHRASRTARHGYRLTNVWHEHVEGIGVRQQGKGHRIKHRKKDRANSFHAQSHFSALPFLDD